MRKKDGSRIDDHIEALEDPEKTQEVIAKLTHETARDFLEGKTKKAPPLEQDKIKNAIEDLEEYEKEKQQQLGKK
jgi:bifunctional DNA-binding transcriptional regulator/antitoxin component of YhaV-PrlF toxin-antitoxin module